MDLNWLIWAILATVSWGSGYAFLKPLGKVSPLVIQILVGAGSFVINLVAMGIWSFVTDEPFDKPWQDLVRNGNNSLYLIGYLCANVFANLAFLVSINSAPNVSLSIVTALTAAYPLVTMIIMFAWFREFEKIELRIAIPGMIVTTIGCAMLALSNKN